MVTSAMTRALDPELAAAYVHELSADVTGVIVLDPEGQRLAGPDAMEAPAQALLAALEEEGATVLLPAGIVWIVKGPERTVVAAAGPAAQPGPTALDVALAAGAAGPSFIEERPSEPLKNAASDVIAAT
ncbi:MAG: hypothetical protein QOD55_327 [Solirubrobacteraceae bacterium]|jgi:hypothetical protein|nr:hypothetical protein [Solirubrobacteraceae bacterium]